MLSHSVRRKLKITHSSLRPPGMYVARFSDKTGSNAKDKLMIPRGYIDSWETINSPEIVEHLRWYVCVCCV